MTASDTELLMQILDLVDPKKRRDAYVTERFFEESVLPCLVSGDYSTGWCYVSSTNSSNDRDWFKVIPFLDCSDYDKEKELVRIIADLLIKKNQRQAFHVVFIRDGESNENRSNEIDFVTNLEIRKLKKRNNGEWYLENNSCPDFVELDKMKSKLKKLLSTISPNSKFCKKWMQGCDYAYLMKLLLQRALMNFGLDQQRPVDVDAIEIDKNGRMVFHEFKRKTPCPSGCYAFGKEEPKDIGSIIEEVREKSRSMPLHRLGYKRENVQCYGLDVSHLRNFEYCARLGIDYRYTIWDSTDYGDKPSINDLFTIKDKGVLQLKRGINLLSQEINPRHFIGFVVTKGKDSGSFYNGLRFQATISKDVFKKVELPCSK